MSTNSMRKKYLERKSPPVGANQPENRGRIMRGNDKRMWISTPNVKGVYSWRAVKSDSRSRRSKRAHSSRRKQLSAARASTQAIQGRVALRISTPNVKGVYSWRADKSDSRSRRSKRAHSSRRKQLSAARASTQAIQGRVALRGGVLHDYLPAFVTQSPLYGVLSRWTGIGLSNAQIVQSLCEGDTDRCVILNMHKDKTAAILDGFATLKHLHHCKPIGKPSANGFIWDLVFKIDKLEAHTVLKSTRDATSDSLMYEYKVGEFLNKIARHLPNFLTTYGVLKYKSMADWENMRLDNKNRLEVTGEEARRRLNATTFNMETGCQQPQLVALLLQNIPKARTLGDFISNASVELVVKNLLPVLFQVYFALTELQESFTHYDLHVDNVLLYKADEKNNKPITFVYNYNERVVVFQCHFIAKIIDYGRAFFSESDANNSRLTMWSAGSNSKCSFFDAEKYEGERHGRKFDWIMSKVSNPSHDLRLLNNMKPLFDKQDIHDALGELVFADYLKLFECRYESHFGTPEHPSCVPHTCTVEDARNNIARIMLETEIAHPDNDFEGGTLGTLTISERKLQTEFKWKGSK